jgi:formylglycine-generating enzyme required for sulfatase activity
MHIISPTLHNILVNRTLSRFALLLVSALLCPIPQSYAQNSCFSGLIPYSVSLGSGSGSSSFYVSTGCGWSAVADQSWIHGSTSGSGPGTVDFTVDANTGTSPRTGIITVFSIIIGYGGVFTITQSSSSCITYALSSTSDSLDSGSGLSSFSVIADSGCAWTATANDAWIHTSSTGSGNGTVSYSVDANTSISSRTGTITVQGQLFTITQSRGSCAYALSATSTSLDSGLRSSSFSVTADSGCTWTATAIETWIHTSSSGSGTGTVNYTVEANTGTTSRTGTIGVQGQTFTVNQSAPNQVPCQLTGMSLSDTVYCFVLNGPVGTNYAVQISSNLVNWLSVSTNTIPAAGWILIADPKMSNQNQQYYRAVLSDAATTVTNMVLIPAGSFTIGDTFNEGSQDELPLHTVYISAFYMDRYEVTKALWDEVKEWNGGNGYSYDNAGSGKAANHPVQTINWFDVVKWCNARSQKEGLTPCYYTDAGLTAVYKTGQVAPQVNGSASGYRLPTEAEWEKGARGGASSVRFPWADADIITHSRANYASDTRYAYDTSPTRGYHPTFNDGAHPYTSPAGYFASNDYGLYDMAGNVIEWCWDWSGGYSSGSQTDPRGSASGSDRVVRGGGWTDGAFNCRAAERGYGNPAARGIDVGFRCARAAGQ